MKDMRRRCREFVILLACVIVVCLYILGPIPASLQLLPDPIDDWAFVIGLLLTIGGVGWVARKFW